MVCFMSLGSGDRNEMMTCDRSLRLCGSYTPYVVIFPVIVDPGSLGTVFCEGTLPWLPVRVSQRPEKQSLTNKESMNGKQEWLHKRDIENSPTNHSRLDAFICPCYKGS